MLHLEDYLEMIEHLPQELRDRFTEMREMDLTVQNNTDALDKRARSLFQQCRKGELPTVAADAEFNAIRSDYYRVLEDSDEKIQLAGQMYDLVERYVRRLDTELYKFKCELEADHNGITEILEKRSLELDSNATSNGGTNQKENRFYDAQAIAQTQQMQQGRRTASLKASYEAIGAMGSQELLINSELAGATHNALQAVERESSVFSNQRRTKKKGVTSVANTGNTSAVAAAAATAGGGVRGTTTTTLLSNNSIITPMLTTAPALPNQTPVASISSLGSQDTTISTKTASTSGAGSTTLTGSSVSAVASESNLMVEQTPEGEWSYDPNEPRYCICNQVSYGDMVACDNEDCPFEWFHYPCVNITSSPKGKWYCPQCSSSMKRRASRKN
ncbi:hypothetical protein ZHAS_00017135 [Anopheles sinensis]|uniref:Inhibitor of growth protein n=1 Tax=Anopheles sinensis TaxID=74873 RepID=A0A084WF80_ANOSI|nr:hypothetical protein ZHAS_00017135 [Anopheles sinensis]